MSKKPTKKFNGVDMREVWDYRLSTAVPTIYRRDTWQVEITSKGPNPKPLAVHDTGIPVEPDDTHDREKISACYEWLYQQRDQFALPDIEERKPIVKRIHELAAQRAELEQQLEGLK